MEQCLYGILVGSANEVANAVGEHIAGSIEGFVDLMNERPAFAVNGQDRSGAAEDVIAGVQET